MQAPRNASPPPRDPRQRTGQRRIIRALAAFAVVSTLFTQRHFASSSPVQPAAPVKPPAPGATVTLPAFHDLRGRAYPPAALAKGGTTLFLFLGTECPVAQTYSPRIVRLEKQYRGKGVRTFAVFSNRQETRQGILRYAAERNFSFPLVWDASGALARSLGATHTPQAVALDGSGRLRYRGRIDDRPHGKEAETSDLRVALGALLKGERVRRPETPAFGCYLALKEKGSSPSTPSANRVTYAREVSRILQDRCVSCHRAGEVAPMRLDTYQQASAFAKTIKAVTQKGTMPPWHAAEGYGHFKDSRRLSAKEKSTLAAWADGGTPLGNPKDLPAPKTFPKSWALGTPDLIFQPRKPYELAAEGDDVYRCFVFPADAVQDTYLSGFEIHPGNRRVVHHVIAFLDQRGQSLELDRKDPGPGYTSTGGGVGFIPDAMLGGWAPGNAMPLLPDGIAVKVPKGGYVVMQVHYHKTGKPETDRTQIGLYLTRKPVNKLMQITMVGNLDLNIPAGEPNYRTAAAWTVPEDMHALGVSPHMHLLGQEMKVKAVRPDGADLPMVHVKPWDFRWQTSYLFAEPLALPKGSQIAVEARYDNSSGNPNNPNNPPQPVRWGERTVDEMCFAFVGVTRDHENLNISVPPVDMDKPLMKFDVPTE